MPATLPHAPPVRIELRWQLVEGPNVRGVVLMQEDGPDLGWTRIGEYQGDRTILEGFIPTERYRFAAAAAYLDGTVDPEDRWQVVEVIPMAAENPLPRPATPDQARFAVSQDGPVINFTWLPVDDPVTTAYEIRVGTSWDAAILVGRDIRTPSFRWHWWSSGTVTFRLRAMRPDGTYSESEATAAFAIQPLGDHVAATTLPESGAGFTGVKSNTAVYSGALELEDVPATGTGLVMVGSAMTWPGWARKKTEGTYTTADTDLGALGLNRFEVTLTATVQKVAGLVGAQLTDVPCPVQNLAAQTPLAIGARPSWWQNHLADGTPLYPLDVLVEIDTSQTDSPSSPIWDGWRAFTPGYFKCRWVRFRFTLRGFGLASPRITVLEIRARRRNLKDEGSIAVALSPGPTTISFATPFTVAPVVVGVVADDTAGLKVVPSNVTKTGCDLRVYGVQEVEVTKAYADFLDPGTSKQIEIYSLPAGWEVVRAFQKHGTAFAGTGIASVASAVGTVAVPDALAPDFDVFAAVSNTNFQRSAGGAMFNAGSATSVQARLTANVGLDNLNAGSVTYRLWVRPVTDGKLGPEAFTGTIKWAAFGS